MAPTHTSTLGLLRYFDYAHLAHGPLQATSTQCAALAWAMASTLPEGPELTTGLRKLLEAKDCFVRAALDIPAASSPRTERAPEDMVE